MSNEDGDDLFSMFGAEDSDDEGQVVDNEAARIGRSLVHLANQQRGGDASHHTASSASMARPSISTTTTTATAAAADQTTLDMKVLNVPSWPDPLYMEPMMVVESLPFYGGGRGCVAKRDLPAGTLVLVEEPLITWPGASFDILHSLEYILQHPNVQTILAVMEEFHPTKRVVDDAVAVAANNSDSKEEEREQDTVEQVSNMMKRVENEFKETESFQRCVELASQLATTKNTDDDSVLSSRDVVRLLVALRYNGLQSGLFVYAAMLNHADAPNCVKFQPTATKAYSEVRTTRPVSAGQALTISYLPTLVSHATRRKLLWEQHRFDIGAPTAAKLVEMELIGRQLPPSNPQLYDNEETTTQRIETAIAELAGVYQDANGSVDWNDPAVVEQIKALEQASLEMCTEAERQLQNQRHVLLIPCRQLHLDSCDLVQRDPNLTGGQRSLLVGRLIATAQKLLLLQKAFHGPDHFDLARTYNDLANAIEQQLSRNPKHLASLGIDGLPSTSAWSALEFQCRQEYNRIKALYPYDVERIIRDSRSNN